jgi:hypothetical protein
VRRFCLHILPARFVKIRHYGLLGNRQRQKRLERARQLLVLAKPAVRPAPAAPETPAQRTARAELLARCPFCRQPALRFVREVAPPRAPRPARLDSS